MWTKRALFLASLACAALSAAANADPLNPGVNLTVTPVLDPFTSTVRWVEVKETSGGAILQYDSPSNAVWSAMSVPDSCGSGTPCTWANPLLEPFVTIQTRADGYDLTYTYTNGTTGSCSLGTLSVSGFFLKDGGGDALQNVNIRDMQRLGRESYFPNFEPYNCDAAIYSHNTKNYPGERYAPVAVFGPELMGNGTYYVGVSLSYPVLDYGHKVMVLQGTPDQTTIGTCEDPRVWEVNFMLNPANGNNGNADPRYRPEGEIEFGQVREYTVHVRFYKVAGGAHPNTWLRTLLPYREFLRDNSTTGCGPVEYTRDTRPVLSRNLGLGNCLDASVGYTDPDIYNYSGSGGPFGRMNQNGWDDWCDLFALDNTVCYWERFMVWAPTGVYCDHPTPHDNFSFRMSTRMDDDSGAPSPNPDYSIIQSTMGCLNTTFPLTGTNKTLGFWWGHSTTVQTGWSWATFASDPLDFGDNGHRTAAKAEMDGAYALNVREVGLDDFGASVWDGLAWIDHLRTEYPGVNFIVEPMCCDLVHRVAPTYIDQDFRETSPGTYYPAADNLLADFFLPGSETWTGVQRSEHPETSITYSQRMQDLAQRGWTIVAVDPGSDMCSSSNPTIYRTRDVASRGGSIANQPSAGLSPSGGIPANLRICIDSDYRSDFNCDGVLTSTDNFDFLAFYFNGDQLADYNMDGVVNSADYFAFTTDFMGGL